jgi:hypothetical protein
MQGSWPEVGGGADGWDPPVGDHVREREGSGRWRACWAGSRDLGRGGKEGGEEDGGLRGPEERRGERGVKSFLFFFNLFKSFSNFKLFSKFKHFKPFASFQIISKSFKTSHPHSKTPCKQNMMHKHLLPLKLFKSDIKYF